MDWYPQAPLTAFQARRKRFHVFFEKRHFVFLKGKCWKKTDNICQYVSIFVNILSIYVKLVPEADARFAAVAMRGLMCLLVYVHIIYR